MPLVGGVYYTVLVYEGGAPSRTACVSRLRACRAAARSGRRCSDPDARTGETEEAPAAEKLRTPIVTDEAPGGKLPRRSLPPSNAAKNRRKEEEERSLVLDPTLPRVSLRTRRSATRAYPGA